MKVIIEFYRVRPQDDAHATVGRETVDAVDVGDAIRLALTLAHSLEMPQQPDGLSITDMKGEILHSQPLGHPTGRG